ncbi:MAG TPA: hypothetical protein VJ904_09765, partial [Tichowtungia sp.]|nr:hypothetical protein [Tichowtungia sp.]
GINKMSVASKTTVGGYNTGGTASSLSRVTEAGDPPKTESQFDVNDSRGVDEFCAMLRNRELEPVFKNWDAAYRSIA